MADVSQPDYEQRMEDVNRVLAEIGAADVPQLLLYNKIDLLPAEQQQPGILRSKSGRIAAVRLSVTQSLGLEDLRQALIEWADTHSKASGGKEAS